MVQFDINSTPKKIALFVVAFLTYIAALYLRLGPEVADDGAFFLRYSLNMLHGEFWVWNLGELPVWGASAPLYPLIVALPMLLGISPVISLIGTGMLLSAASLSLIVVFLASRFGLLSAFAFLAFTSLDTGIMYYSGAGLETPLTLLLLCAAVLNLYGRGSLTWAGIIAGLLFINKLDLIPAGGFFLLAVWLREEKFPVRAIIISIAIAAAWYLFAWKHFGAPVPNSFLTKSLHQEDLPKSIDWRWFGGFVLTTGFHSWLVMFSVIGLINFDKKIRPLFLFLLGLLFTHLAAYTIKFPFEPYNWYCMPSVFVLLILSAIGISRIGELAVLHKGLPKGIMSSIPVILVLFVFFTNVKSELRGTKNIINFSSHQEFDRAEAGRWVEANTPANFTVYTMWGNPAYFSNRKVLDGSFLNRHFESSDLIKTYHPEILILQNNPGSTPMDPIFAVTKGEGYKVVKVFDKSYAAGMDYFFTVLAREDVVNQISNVELPLNLMKYVQKVELGDTFGILKPQDKETLFAHPGLKLPTKFQFDTVAFVKGKNVKQIKVRAFIAPNVPVEAINRGGAEIRISVKQNGTTLAEAVVNSKYSFEQDFIVSESGGQFEFIVDNNGNPDTDWLLISVK